MFLARSKNISYFYKNTLAKNTALSTDNIDEHACTNEPNLN
jgi:hypothetical protein